MEVSFEREVKFNILENACPDIGSWSRPLLLTEIQIWHIQDGAL